MSQASSGARFAVSEDGVALAGCSRRCLVGPARQLGMRLYSTAKCLATKLSSDRRLARNPPVGEKARKGMMRVVPVYALGSGLKKAMNYFDAFGGPYVPHSLGRGR